LNTHGIEVRKLAAVLMRDPVTDLLLLLLLRGYSSTKTPCRVTFQLGIVNS
jgi:hypothetical protein